MSTIINSSGAIADVYPATTASTEYEVMSYVDDRSESGASQYDDYGYTSSDDEDEDDEPTLEHQSEWHDLCLMAAGTYQPSSWNDDKEGEKFEKNLLHMKIEAQEAKSLHNMIRLIRDGRMEDYDFLTKVAPELGSNTLGVVKKEYSNDARVVEFYYYCMQTFGKILLNEDAFAANPTLPREAIRKSIEALDRCGVDEVAEEDEQGICLPRDTLYTGIRRSTFHDDDDGTPSTTTSCCYTLQFLQFEIYYFNPWLKNTNWVFYDVSN